ncbi:unnamed protein product, partial [marine sediment metagenome]
EMMEDEQDEKKLTLLEQKDMGLGVWQSLVARGLVDVENIRKLLEEALENM